MKDGEVLGGWWDSYPLGRHARVLHHRPMVHTRDRESATQVVELNKLSTEVLGLDPTGVHSLLRLPKACWWDLNDGRNNFPGQGRSRVKFSEIPSYIRLKFDDLASHQPLTLFGQFLSWAHVQILAELVWDVSHSWFKIRKAPPTENTASYLLVLGPVHWLVLGANMSPK